MVNARLRATVIQAFSSESPRHFNFLDCENETSKCFEFEYGTFRLLVKTRAPNLDESYENELE